MADNVAQSVVDLEALAASMGLVGREVPKLARFALRDALRNTRVHTRRSVQSVLLLKAGSINRRSRVVPPRGERLVGDLIFDEKAAPLLSSYASSGGNASGRGKLLTVKVRANRPAETIKGGFLRPNRNAKVDAADAGRGGGKVAYRRATIDGRLVGRLPYNAARGPSPLGLLESRPGFADAEQDFLADETEALFVNKVNAALERVAGGDG